MITRLRLRGLTCPAIPAGVKCLPLNPLCADICLVPIHLTDKHHQASIVTIRIFPLYKRKPKNQYLSS
jgi:hypothetical protein